MRYLDFKEVIVSSEEERSFIPGHIAKGNLCDQTQCEKFTEHNKASSKPPMHAFPIKKILTSSYRLLFGMF